MSGLRMAKYYDISETEIMVGDYYEVIKSSGCDSVQPINFDEALAPTYQGLKIIRVPIKHVRRINHDGNGKEEIYFGVSPKLNEILRQPYLQEIQELEENSKRTIERLHGFNNLPWYKRILKALKPI